MGEVRHSYKVTPLSKGGVKSVKLPSIPSIPKGSQSQKALAGKPLMNRTQLEPMFPKYDNSPFRNQANPAQPGNSNQSPQKNSDQRGIGLPKSKSSNFVRKSDVDPLFSLKYGKLEKNVKLVKNEREAVEALWEEPKNRKAYLRNMNKTITSLKESHIMKSVDQKMLELQRAQETQIFVQDHIDLTDKQGQFKKNFETFSKGPKPKGFPQETGMALVDKYSQSQSNIRSIVNPKNIQFFEKYLKDVLKITNKFPEFHVHMINNFRNVSLEEFDAEMDTTQNHSYLIKKYPEGVSRFMDTNGKICWSQCKILSYDVDKRLFTIEWKDSGITKQVKRLNLVYGNDRVEDFEERRLKANVIRCEQLYRRSLNGFLRNEDQLLPTSIYFSFKQFQEILKKIGITPEDYN